MNDPELFMLYVWAEMYKEGKCYPYFDSISGMRRCIFEATGLPSPNELALPVYQELMRRVAMKRLK